jgi:hypothetical protein
MAQRIEVFLIDDTAGKDIPAGKGGTVSFALDSQAFEIDLADRNAAALRKALLPYVDAARVVTTARGAKVKRTKVGSDAKTVKEWARVNGYVVNDRGRIPDDVRAAFEAAN